MSKTLKILTAIIILFTLGVGVFFFWRNEWQKGRRNLDLGNLGNAVYTAVIMYANDNAEHFPADLGVLMDQQYLTAPHIYRCLYSDATPPQNGDDIREGQCDYLYFGKGRKASEKSFPLIIVKPEIHENYLLVVYSDGKEVQYTPPPADLLSLTVGLMEETHNKSGLEGRLSPPPGP